MTAKALTPLTTLLLLVLSGASAWVHAAKPPDWLLGEWTLNNDLTVAAQADAKSGFSNPFGNVKPSISVGGVNVPIGSTQPSGGSGKDPDVLRCSGMMISMQGERLHLNYTGVGEESLLPGKEHGRVTRWSKKKLTTGYETTSRKVSETFALQADNTLLVTIKLKPRQGKGVVHKRVFERPGT